VKNMPSFTLRLNDTNYKIAKLYEDGENIKTAISGDSITVSFAYGMTILRMEVDAIKTLTDKEWRNLAKEIKSTLKGAKIRELTDLAIRISPLKTKDVHLRISPLELELIRKAAEKVHKSTPDFIRMTALEKADQVLIAKTEIEERVKSKLKRPQETEIYG